MGTAKTFLGSWPLLYAWINFHIMKDERGNFDIFDARPLARVHILATSASLMEWKYHLAVCNSRNVTWMAPWLRIDRIIFKCGNHDCIPLLGIRGCSSYAPQYILRQFNVLQYIPQSKSLAKFGPNTEYPSEVQRREIPKAWKSIDYLPLPTLPMHNETVPGYALWRQGKAPEPRLEIEGSPSTVTRNYEIENQMQATRIQELERMVATLEGRVHQEQEERRQRLIHEAQAHCRIEVMATTLTNKKRKLDEMTEQLQTMKDEMWVQDQTAQIEINHLEIQLEYQKAEYESEIAALREAMRKLEAESQEKQEVINRVKIMFVPAYDMLVNISRQLRQLEDSYSPLNPPPPAVITLIVKCMTLINFLTSQQE